MNTNGPDDIHDFLENFSNNFEKEDLERIDYQSLINFKVTQSECMYILDFRLNAITFSLGIFGNW